MVMLIRAAILSFVCLTQELTQGFSVAPSRRSAVSSTSLYHSYDYSKWDDLEDDDEDITFENLRKTYPVSFRYNTDNMMRSDQTFRDIRGAGGPETTSDCYVREPGSDTWYFIGKVARVSDISLELCVAAQWNLIEAHAIILRHKELYPYRGSLELWTAPGDSELDVSYNRPNIVFQKMERIVEGSRAIKKHFVGFKPEIYDGDEEGFRTWRTEDGRAAKPEVVRASEGGDDEKREPSQEELDAMMAQISELAEEERADQERDQEETIKKHLKDAA